MKTRLLLIAGLLLTAHIGFSQRMATKSYDIKNYKAISVGNALDVKLIPDGKEGITIKCDERLIPAIDIYKKGNLVDISLNWKAIDKICGKRLFGRNNRNISIGKNRVKINGKTFMGGIQITAHVKHLKRLSVRSSGNITWNGDLVTKSMILDIWSSGDIKWNGTLQADDLEINCSSSGNVVGNCHCKSVNISLGSSGDFVGDITANDVMVRLSSSGDFKGEVNAETAQFDLSSSSDARVSGKIRYLTVNASSSANFFGKKVIYNKAEVKTGSSADIYLSKSGEIIDRTPRRTGVHFD